MAVQKSLVQQLSDLVEWFIADRGVELRFVPNKQNKGLQSPEFDFTYYIDGRRITQKALAMLIMMELMRRNYAYNLARIISQLVEHSWRYYVANCEYPWLDAPPVKRVVGRPRVHPEPIPFLEGERPEPGNAKKAIGRPRKYPRAEDDPLNIAAQEATS